MLSKTPFRIEYTESIFKILNSKFEVQSSKINSRVTEGLENNSISVIESKNV